MKFKLRLYNLSGIILKIYIYQLNVKKNEAIKRKNELKI